MMNRFLCTVAISTLVFCVGCDEKEKTTEVLEAAKVEAPPEKTAEQKAEQEKEAAAAAEAKSKADEAAQAEAERAKDPVIACCRSLGQKGFTLRSPLYMSASKVCGEAMSEKKLLSDVIANIKKELKGEALPEECETK